MSYISVSNLSEKLEVQYQALKKEGWEKNAYVTTKERTYTVAGSNDQDLHIRVQMVHTRFVTELTKNNGCMMSSPYYSVVVEMSQEDENVKAAVAKSLENIQAPVVGNRLLREFEDYHITFKVNK